MTKYRWISARKAEGFPVTAACAIAQVPRASYYEFCVRAAQPTNAELDEALFINEILNVHRFHDDTYGSPRMTAELRRRGFCANHKRIERLMAANGICARDGRRRRVRTTISSLFDPQLPDLVQRDFSVGRPGERSCGDITYIATSEGWLYLADVMDLGSRRVIGFAMAERMPTELVAQALEMAATTRDGDLMGMIFHHDRGSQYLSGDFQRLCRRLGVRQSVGPGVCSKRSPSGQSLTPSNVRKSKKCTLRFIRKAARVILRCTSFCQNYWRRPLKRAQAKVRRRPF